MKKKYIFLIILFIAAVFSANATIWRVNNNAGINTGITTLQQAHDTASVGDTIYLKFSPNNYGGCTFTKKLLVIGTGYFLTANPNTPANKAAATVNVLTFNTGAQGTIVTGVYNTTFSFINTDSIILRRNVLGHISMGAMNNTVSNIILEQNYFTGSINLYYSYNVIVSNNIIGRLLYSTGSSSATIVNNIINTDHTIYSWGLMNSTIHNNIFHAGNPTFTNCELKNNIFHSTGTNANGNQYGIVMDSVFVGTGSPDGKFMLKSNSPAIGAGLGGTDCGVFGGSNPYVLSGLPAVPYIYEAIIPTSGSTTGGLPVQIKIRSNN
jgi:hypothetical protein